MFKKHPSPSVGEGGGKQLESRWRSRGRPWLASRALVLVVLALQGAVRSCSGPPVPFIHLRLGQCELELGNRERAVDELARAYKGGGEELFSGEDPKYLGLLGAAHSR